MDKKRAISSRQWWHTGNCGILHKYLPRFLRQGICNLGRVPEMHLRLIVDKSCETNGNETSD